MNDYEIDDDNITKVHGITIINGAQSTGAIGAVESLKEDFLVPSSAIAMYAKALLHRNLLANSTSLFNFLNVA